MSDTASRAAIALLAASLTAAAQSYAPAANNDYATTVYWGDTHVHTSYSTGDANLMGLNVVSPTVAYRFARGETVTANNGMPVRIRKPLDFLVIADHAENLGVAASVRASDRNLLAAPGGRELLERFQAHQADPDAGRLRFAPHTLGDDYIRSVWGTVIADADAFNDPGEFTAFAGYEWTSVGTVAGVFGNLHRVVVFRDDAGRTGRILPFSAYDSRHPEDLWAFLERYEADTGGQVIAIPHNGNTSNGAMFALTDSRGAPQDARYAAMRSRFEPLYEVTQIKGDSETHPVLSPTDEFADFETWHSWAGGTMEPGYHPCCPDWGTADFEGRKRGEYARSALRRGLVQESLLGVNPFKYGLIGSTDAHTSFATADNDNFWGKYSITFPSPTRISDPMVTSWDTPLNWETGAAGYAAVWARENTREAIFDALKRREVYATTGPRITLRFFGGWGFASEDAFAPDVAMHGYARGVPMGADLPPRPGPAAPTFLIAALRDPAGANLDRIQVVKGWLEADGTTRERVHDVALADGRAVRADGAVAPVGSTVDVAAASYTNAIGDPELRVTWTDPDFDPGRSAFYYVRVLEIPTPRWTAYDARFFGIEELPEGIRMVSQERAYSSPIWYAPR
ncbi:MAG: DUF3604 domain-containing protein [Gammaproteobacteria bacterium]|nr:DUF3604 domain-containing protein [Gammaproteobacteria bacterium]